MNVCINSLATARRLLASDRRAVARTSSLLICLVLLPGCAFLDKARQRTAAPDDRVRLEWQDGARYLTRRESSEYTCAAKLILTCERAGAKFWCRCEAR